jgi:hypothetical protein
LKTSNIAVTALACVLAWPVLAEELKRTAKEVKNVSGKHEFHRIYDDSRGDAKSKIAEADLDNVSAYNDKDRLRLDIGLKSSFTGKHHVCYAFRVILKDDVEEWYAYFPLTKKLHYGKFKKNECIEDQVLGTNEGSDEVSMGDVIGKGGKKFEDALIVLYIDKDKHFSKEGKGKTKHMDMQVFSATYEKGLKDAKIVDKTDRIELSYER